jgi:glycosyltransferase involved in cell wall biosynthesis
MSDQNNHNSIFIIIPAYNEETTLSRVVDGLLEYNYEVVVVDDGSTKSLHTLLQDKPVHFLRHAVNLGQGAALQTGIEYALSKDAEFIITFDADGQHQPEDVGKLIMPLAENNADITLGSRFIKDASHNMPQVRKIILQFARYLNYFLTGLLLSDAHNGMRAMNRKAAEKISFHENGMAHATEILSIVRKNQLRYREVPVNIYYTEHSLRKGQSIWSSFRIIFDILLNKIFK